MIVYPDASGPTENICRRSMTVIINIVDGSPIDAGLKRCASERYGPATNNCGKVGLFWEPKP
jgi:hypothetical protein